ncbi:cobalt-precorrin 5A acetaldehyde-lyase [Malonomonas rubra DSM 5091]|uniref:Cobalt-precorrin 5A acetaldehyde-lyase n=1 Tax=Malonomonas rubra DSM 5091 TaxID=1122189 RepID=A0A1M6GMA7_MALRU|nr:cobalt-precorrin 5A hydrolase [Malonomonas rubra]SHJ11071.1 cobalt-precorrin 5A acetaldehyde-lyase [Malonomonas rubra DSM 5091]
MKLAIVAITSRGAQLARHLGAKLPEARVFLPEKYRSGDDCDYFDKPLAVWLPSLFAEVEQLVCIMATGIVVRILGRELQGKDKDAAVVVMDEAGQFAISLLSGHLGGANDLARRLATVCGATPVITTATDVNKLPAWDQVARDVDLVVEPVAHLKTLNSLLLEGRKIGLVDQRRRVADKFVSIKGVSLYDNFAAATRSSADGLVFVTHRFLPHLQNQPEMLALRPRDLVVGIGCNRGTSDEEIEQAVRSKLKQSFLAFASIACIASIDAKQDEAGLLQFAERHNLPLKFFSADELNKVEIPSPVSLHAQKAVGAKGVCEPAALLASNMGEMLIRKQKVGNLTIAVAEIQD